MIPPKQKRRSLAKRVWFCTPYQTKRRNSLKPRSSLLCGLGPSKEEEEDEDDDGVQTLPAIQIQTSDTTNDNSHPSSSFSDWMADLPVHAHHKPFNQLSIPGSHDSCTASLDRDGGLHPDAPELYRDVLRVLGSWAKTVALRWSQTQDRTFEDQLDIGIRYFDLRISVRPGFQELFLVHGFYGESVGHCLTTISSWLDSHPKEIVLLDMNHFHGLEDDHHQSLIKDIHEIFGGKLVPVRNDARNLTLAEMWKERQQVIVFYHHVKRGVSSPNRLQPTIDFLWPGSMIPSPWPRATRIKDLIEFLERDDHFHSHSRHCQQLHQQQQQQQQQHQVSSSPHSPDVTSPMSPPTSHPPPNRARNPGSFYVSQGVLTPTVYTVIGHVTSSLKDHFGRQAAHAIVDWLRRRRRQMTTTTTPATATSPVVEDQVEDDHSVPPQGRKDSSLSPPSHLGVKTDDVINIVIVDFVDLEPAYVEAVVSLNYVDSTTAPTSADALSQQLSPVLQFLQLQQQQTHEQPAMTQESTINVGNLNVVAHNHGHNPSQKLIPDVVTSAAAAASSALSSRALTPTPLHFIDSGGNSPSVTPLRHAASPPND